MEVNPDGRRDPGQDFVLCERLGEGSYGSVWRAEHAKTGTSTAIKRVPVDNDLEEIINEIKIMKQCKSPYIVNYFGSYFKDQELWIVMEHCSGGSANDLMRVTEKMFTEGQISAVMRDSLKGLYYLHSVRKIHRDIKAGNILLNSKGECKLADFGVSGQLADNMAKRQTVIGTPFWMAPEVIQEVGYDVKADIWSLGITAIELAEGKPPNSNIHPMRAIFMIPSRPPPTLTEPAKWSNEFNTFIARCLVKNPDDRPSAQELLSHPYVTKSKPASVLIPLIQEADRIIAEVGREKALGLEDDSDDESDLMGTSAQRRGESGPDSRVPEDSDGFSTMVVSEGPSNPGTMVFGGADSGTMVNSGTMVGPPSADNGDTPYFMQHMGISAGAGAGAGQVEPKLHPQYAKFSKEQLAQMVQENETRMNRELDSIREKFALQKQQIEGAMSRLA